MKILICIACKEAYPPDNIIGHQRDQHKIKISRSDLKFITDSFSVHKKPKDVITPLPLQAPIDGIKIQSGFTCADSGCFYVCISEDTMRVHWSKNHNEKMRITTKKTRMNEVEVQTLFGISSGRHYFSVDSRLKGAISSDIFTLFIQQHGSRISLTPSVAPPIRDRDLPILVKELGWYPHLQQYCEDAGKRDQLMKMVALPKAQDKPLSQLSHVVEAYLRQIQDEESLLTRLTKRSLMNYPL